jgi:hypothetical protein
MIMDKKLLWCGVILFVFYGFDLKPLAPFVRSCACEKYKNVIEHCFISFPGSLWLHEKGTPLDFSLSSFQTLETRKDCRAILLFSRSLKYLK